MKNATVWMLALLLTFGLTACGGKNKENSQTQPESTAGQTTESTTERTTESAVEEQTGSNDNAYGNAGMEDLKAAVVEALGENYWPNMTLEPDMFGEMFGVTEDMYEEYFAEMPMISTNVDTLVIVKAKEGQTDAVEEALNAYRDMKVNDTLQYPMNIGKIQASRVEVIGDYVCFVQLGADVADAMDQGEDAVIEQCQEANETALEAIRSKLS